MRDHYINIVKENNMISRDTEKLLIKFAIPNTFIKKS